jgi:alkylation response protein AidB-like acyl-CoA dehydrogenase
MHFDFDDTQYALREMARDLFAKESPAARIRGLWDGKPFDRGVWKTMADAGIVGITVPEEHGGSGGDALDLALVYEEAGRACLPEPLLETTGIAAPLIARFGSDEQRARWLPAIAAGDVVAAVQSGDEEDVAWGAEADLVIAARGSEFHAVGRDRVTATSVASLDPARPLARLDIDIGPDTRLTAPEDFDIVSAFYCAAFTGTAGILNGIAAELRDRTVAYVKDREQFGRPVGSFQAVKHKLASMHVALESSRPATWYAAYATAKGLDGATVAACIAKIAANDAEALANADSLQCHGGIGFTWEDDLHFWLKRGVVLRSIFGTSRELRGQLVRVHDWDDLL